MHRLVIYICHIIFLHYLHNLKDCCYDDRCRWSCTPTWPVSSSTMPRSTITSAGSARCYRRCTHSSTTTGSAIPLTAAACFPRESVSDTVTLDRPSCLTDRHAWHTVTLDGHSSLTGCVLCGAISLSSSSASFPNFMWGRFYLFHLPRSCASSPLTILSPTSRSWCYPTTSASVFISFFFPAHPSPSLSCPHSLLLFSIHAIYDRKICWTR